MISGLQKMTLLDFPGKIACTVFLHGCNMRCPFCHNSELLGGKGEELMTREAFFAFLKTRKGLLDGVCVSGGEPTLQRDLPEFLREIKDLGFAVKLDTNGTRPEVLKALVAENLVDYVAVDVKNCPRLYAQTAGAKLEVAQIEETFRFLMADHVDYELRTTLVEPLHDGQCVEEMGQWLSSLLPGKKPKRWFLQRLVDRDPVVFSGLSAPEENAVSAYAGRLAQYAEQVAVRN